MTALRQKDDGENNLIIRGALKDQADLPPKFYLPDRFRSEGFVQGPVFPCVD